MKKQKTIWEVIVHYVLPGIGVKIGPKNIKRYKVSTLNTTATDTVQEIKQSEDMKHRILCRQKKKNSDYQVIITKVDQLQELGKTSF